MKKYFNYLRIVFYALFSGPILLIGFFSLLIPKGTIMLNNEIDSVFKYLIPVFGIILIPVGFFLFRKNLKDTIIIENIDLKLQKYKEIIVQRIAIITGVAMFSAVAFLITMNNLYIMYTLFILLIYIPIYPNIKKLYKDLGLSAEDIIDHTGEHNKSNIFFGKKPWLIIPMIAFMTILNYNSFKEFFANKVVLPNIQIDNGAIIDSIYHNDYLNWTIRIPKGYMEMSLSEMEKQEKKGSEILNNETDENDKPIRLLNISNGLVDFKSNLNPRVLYPDITSEEKYLEIIDKQLLDANIESVIIEKQNQGIFLIDSLKFNYVEYFMTGKNKVGFMFITRINKDFIFDISLTYRDTQKAIEMLEKLKTSELNWE